MRVEEVAPLSPLLRSPNRESGVALPRNISTRTGVCRVEAVRKTVVSPRAWIVLRSTRARFAAEIWESDRRVVERRGIE